MSWPVRFLVVGIGASAFGATAWGAALQSRLRHSEEQVLRAQVARICGAAKIIFAGPPLVAAGLAGLVTRQPSVAGIFALGAGALEVPLASRVLLSHPRLRLPDWRSPNDQVGVRADSLRRRSGPVYWSIVGLTLALTVFLVSMVLRVWSTLG